MSEAHGDLLVNNLFFLPNICSPAKGVVQSILINILMRILNMKLKKFAILSLLTLTVAACKGEAVGVAGGGAAAAISGLNTPSKVSVIPNNN